jgi:hypothetical protein
MSFEGRVGSVDCIRNKDSSLTDGIQGMGVA